MEPLASNPLNPPPLHIPDGFLSPPISILTWVLTALLLAIALRKSQDQLGERLIPLMGIMAAFIFAAQMINFPVLGGTSGHLLGGTLAAIVLGPWAGMLVMTAVIAVQALLFQDGGLVVMGANIFNMGLLTALIGYGLYQATSGRGLGFRLIAIGVAAWLSVMAGALATALQLWLSGTSPLRVVVPAMLGVHALIGVGEALITVAALAFLLQTRPDLMQPDQGGRTGRAWALVGLLVSLIVVLISPLASTDPDGLERVAHDLGFINLGGGSPYQILPDYTLPSLGDTPISTILAGALGVAIVGGIVYLAGRVIRRPPAKAKQ